MKKLLILLFSISFLISCKEDKKSLQRPAYLFFKLGSTPEEVLKELRSLVSTGGLTRKEDDFYWSNELDGNEYQYAPVFTFTQGDSLCTEMKLIYFDQLEAMQSDLYAFKRNEVPMNLMYWAIGRVKSWKLRDNVVENIVAEKGPYTSRDTVDFSDNLLELTSWKDKDGVDIVIRFRFPKDKLTKTPFAGNSSLSVTYSNSEEGSEK